MMYTPWPNTRLITNKDQETNTDLELHEDNMIDHVVEECEETNTDVDGDEEQEINIMDQYDDQLTRSQIDQGPKSSENFDKVNEENEDKFPETNDYTEVVLEPLDTTLLDQYISHGI